MEAIISTEQVSRVFHSGSEQVYALRDVSISVAEKSLVILRGRSGSGKTTLLNILGALDYPTNGKVIFDGQEISKLRESARNRIRRDKLGFVFQSFALIPLMSAIENVDFGLRVSGIPARERKKRAEEALAFVGLTKRANHRPFELSGGEQQRVAIARAIAHRPRLILADEPTAELDSKMGLQVMKVFKDLVEKESITIIMTSHDPSILEVADHVFTLDDGKII